MLVAVLLLGSIALMRGNPWYALAPLWGLIGVYVKQHASSLSGAGKAATIALVLAVVVALETVWLFWQWRRTAVAN